MREIDQRTKDRAAVLRLLEGKRLTGPSTLRLLSRAGCVA